MSRFYLSRLSFAREKAALLKKHLGLAGVDTTLTKCRDVMAKLYGYRDFHELTQITKAAKHPPSPLSDEPLISDTLLVAPEFLMTFDVAARTLEHVRPRALNGSRQRSHTNWQQLELPVMPLMAHNLEPSILQHLRPQNGLFLITGITGSGKTGIIASIIENITNSAGSHEKVIDLYYGSRGVFIQDSPAIDQIDVVQNFYRAEHDRSRIDDKPMAYAIKNALRRKPNVIAVAKIVDGLTLSSAIHAAITGHLLYSTMVSVGVSATLRRLAQFYPEPVRDTVAPDILKALRVIVSQTLVPSLTGDRIPLREFLIFDDEVKERLGKVSIGEWPEEARRIMSEGKSQSQTIYAAAQKAYDAGQISEDIRSRLLILHDNETPKPTQSRKARRLTSE